MHYSFCLALYHTACPSPRGGSARGSVAALPRATSVQVPCPALHTVYIFDYLKLVHTHVIRVFLLYAIQSSSCALDIPDPGRLLCKLCKPCSRQPSRRLRRRVLTTRHQPRLTRSFRAYSRLTHALRTPCARLAHALRTPCARFAHASGVQGLSRCSSSSRVRSRSSSGITAPRRRSP